MRTNVEMLVLTVVVEVAEQDLALRVRDVLWRIGRVPMRYERIMQNKCGDRERTR